MQLAWSADLHFLPQPSLSAAALIPQMAYIGAIVDTLLEEMLRLRPTALLLCGDLTNGGLPEEHRALLSGLDRLEDANIPVLVLPGNHDLDRTSAQEFSSLYRRQGYGAALSRDPASLSYTAALAEGWRLVALDTNAGGAIEGLLGPETLCWLEEALHNAQADAARVIVACHHNLLPYRPRGFSPFPRFFGSEEAVALLQRWNVPLVLSGHRHHSRLAREGSLRELTAPMPARYPHLYGRLTASAHSLDCETIPLDVQGHAQHSDSAAPLPLSFSDYSRSCPDALARLLNEPERPTRHHIDLS